MNVFTGKAIQDSTLGKAGTLTMTNEEFAAWYDKKAFVEFVQNENTVRDEHTTAVPAVQS